MKDKIQREKKKETDQVEHSDLKADKESETQEEGEELLGATAVTMEKKIMTRSKKKGDKHIETN